MAKIKSYTNISQSKKLAKILPIESADGFWEYHDMGYSEGDEWEGYEDYPRAVPYLEYTREYNEWKNDKSDVPCWSLSALLDVLESEIDGEEGETYQLNIEKGGTWWNVWYREQFDEADPIEVEYTEDIVDACVNMILKLKGLNLL